ncbi:MAG: pH regulation protein F [Clostridia bacterium]|nr:pH regulation protein F [Clostridia bacterium]NCC75841.1 pH regulation protein F [Clostridia bacterium]
MSPYLFAVIALSVLMVLVLILVIRGPSVWDRLLGLNMFSSKITVFIVLLAGLTGQPYLLDIALVYAVLGFIGTILMAKFVERR